MKGQPVYHARGVSVTAEGAILASEERNDVATLVKEQKAPLNTYEHVKVSRTLNGRR